MSQVISVHLADISSYSEYLAIMGLSGSCISASQELSACLRFVRALTKTLRPVDFPLPLASHPWSQLMYASSSPMRPSAFSGALVFVSFTPPHSVMAFRLGCGA